MEEPKNDKEHVEPLEGAQGGAKNPSRRDDLLSLVLLLVYFET
jgi:hypothetical protein